MDVTIVGLQNAGKTSLLRVLAVRSSLLGRISKTTLTDLQQGGEFTIEYVVLSTCWETSEIAVVVQGCADTQLARYPR
jgi:50S ribosome-binding GTPase